MEGPPAVRPVGGHVRLLGGTERARDPRADDPVGVGRELQLAAALAFLEALRDELEHPCAGLLRAFERNGHRDAAETAQRKALFSLSKKPSSGR